METIVNVCMVISWSKTVIWSRHAECKNILLTLALWDSLRDQILFLSTFYPSEFVYQIHEQLITTRIRIESFYIKDTYIYMHLPTRISVLKYLWVHIPFYGSWLLNNNKCTNCISQAHFYKNNVIHWSFLSTSFFVQ